MKIRKFRTLLVSLIALVLTVGVMPQSAGAAGFSLFEGKNLQQALSSASRSSSSTSSTFDIADDDHLVAFLTVTAATGSTLDVKFQDSPDGGTTWFDLTGASFAQVTSGSSSQTIYATRVPARKIRVSYTIAGGAFTFHVEFMSYKASLNIVSSTDANAANLTSGTLPLARLVDITNTQMSASAAVAYSKLALTGSIVNADLSSSAAIAASKLATDVVQTTSVTVATGSVLTLNATPVQLVAAPGAGKAIIIDGIVAKLVFNSIAYTGSNALEFRYTDGSGAKVTADIAASFINSASGTNYASVAGVTTALTPVANAAVVVRVPTADPGAGNSPIVFTIRYHVVTP